MQQATFAASDGPFVRYHADLVIPEATWTEITALKGIASYYVMQADDRVALQARQRELLEELVAVLLDRAPEELDEAFVADWHTAPDDDARLRVVVDQVASLTDASALSWHRRLT